jgi:hypothetical protein
LTDEPREVPVINVEIVLVFPDAMALMVVLEIVPKGIWECRDGPSRRWCSIFI